MASIVKTYKEEIPTPSEFIPAQSNNSSCRDAFASVA